MSPMSMLKSISKIATLLFAVSISSAVFAQSMPGRFGIGTNIGPQDLAKFYSIPQDGRGLPPGSGNAAAGATVYADTCAACHGDKLQGNPAKGIGGDRLVGGRGPLATAPPIKTVESYLPYSNTFIDYVETA